jgi:hypothetical protein
MYMLNSTKAKANNRMQSCNLVSKSSQKNLMNNVISVLNSKNQTAKTHQSKRKNKPLSLMTQSPNRYLMDNKSPQMLSIMTSFNGEGTAKHLESTLLKDSFLGTAHQRFEGSLTGGIVKPSTAPEERREAFENESGAFQGGGEIE